MSSTYQELYRQDIFTLVRTMVVKSVATAEAINSELSGMGYAVSSDETTWKYYKNISGQYHSTDTLMQVTSLDSLETIDFTVENLAINVATKEAYAYGSSYYTNLVSQYPLQEQLILGILNPVDINTAIAADDNEILYYDTNLVESNETNLIPTLQAWTKAFFLRWAHPVYELVDDLYRPGVLALYWSKLPILIELIRLRNCKTRYAHSFHVWTYLESNGHLRAYKDYLTTKQALWLYRNINYLQLNAGKKEIQSTLIEHIMTERNLPVASYDLAHDITDFEKLEDLLPAVTMLRSSRNTIDSTTNSNAGQTVQAILNKEIKLARDNGNTLTDDEGTITSDMQTSVTSRLSTKVLESNMLVSDAGDVYPYASVLWNEWLHKGVTGYYTANIQVNNPSTGDIMSMTPVDAFIVYLYCFNRSVGITMDTIPDVPAWRVRKIPLPTLSDLRKVVDSDYVDDDKLQWILDSNVVITTMPSRQSFFDTMLAVHDAQTNQYFYYSEHEHKTVYGQLECALNACYDTVLCVLDPQHRTFEEYFTLKGWSLDNLSIDYYTTIAADVLKYATAQDLTNAKSVKDIQTAMLSLMTKMSSYSTQWLQSINGDTLKLSDGANHRFGDDATQLFSHTYLKGSIPEIIGLKTVIYDREELDIFADSNMEDTAWLQIKDYAEVDPAPDVTYVSQGYDYSAVRNPTPYAKLRIQDLVEKLLITDLPGLTVTQLEPIDPDNPENIDINDLIPVSDLPGLVYPLAYLNPVDELSGLVIPLSSMITNTVLDGLGVSLSSRITEVDLNGLSIALNLELPNNVLDGLGLTLGSQITKTELDGLDLGIAYSLGNTVLNGLGISLAQELATTELNGLGISVAASITDVNLDGLVFPTNYGVGNGLINTVLNGIFIQ